MNNKVIRALDSEGPDKVLDLSFLPDDIAETVGAAMNRMRDVAQAAEDGKTPTLTQMEQYPKDCELVIDTMQKYLRRDDCGLPQHKREALMAHGEDLRPGVVRLENIAKVAKAIGIDDDSN